ncbi:MAG: MFS transporter [Anaerococcus sp.]|uniref:MFS transporter n=1 Tax=Anaerococcus sp. TaxID=1872515 RepID=UPI00262A5CE6|nr:MFS transporter [Anaerococcus sp.]MCI5972931.1 MFS transporter [Anaerococcus sp.]MDD6918925.1 MFS transporter [Peptoniphilaceae bacterium]
MLLTSLAAIANYGVYTYITNLIRAIDYTRGIGFAQVLFGLGSIISVLIAAKVIDRHIRSLTIFMFGSALLALIIFAYFSNYSLVCDLAFLLWGIGFGALVSLFQTTVARQVRENASAVATSLQSASFNFSIMLASALAGSLITNYSVKFMLSFMCLVLIASIFVAFSSKKTLS